MIARVLLADDDEMVRRAIGNCLARAGFEVIAVDDGAPAIEMADKTPFDFIVADLNMKTIGGVDVIKHYKKQFGIAVCCIVLSGDDDEATQAACYLAGADDVITKPTTPSELRRRLLSAAVVLRGRAA